MLNILTYILELIFLYLGLNILMLLMSLSEMKSQLKRHGLIEYKEWKKRNIVFLPILYVEHSLSYLYSRGAFKDEEV